MELSVGARIGLNLSSIIGDTETIMGPRIGINAEAFASEWFNENFGLQEEIGLGSRGESWKNSETVDFNVLDKFASSLTYLEIPILAKWRFVQLENLRPVLYGGITLGFPIIAESEYFGNSTDMEQHTQPIDLGLTAGVSLDIKRGNAIIPIDLRYTWGATNYLNNPNYPLVFHHSVLSLSVGFGWILDFAKKSEF
jgi:hypothetical protein